MKIEDLGLSADELRELIVQRAVDQLITNTAFDEYGDEHETPSSLATKINSTIRQRIDEKVDELGNKHVLPNVTKAIESVTLQETNQWGEAKGEKLTFIEYLTQRAEAYMTEPVNHSGKTKREDSYSWRPSTTRMAYMIDSHLQYSIGSAIKKILQGANDSLGKSLKGAVDEQLKKLTAEINVKIS